MEWEKVGGDEYEVWVKNLDEENYIVMPVSLNQNGKWAYVKVKVGVDGEIDIIDKGISENPWDKE